MNLPQLPADAANHWVYGSVGAVLTIAGLHALGGHGDYTYLTTMSVSWGVFLAFKLYSYAKLGAKFDGTDFFTDAFAQLAGTLVVVAGAVL